MFPFFPFSNAHQLNLDWILEELSKLPKTVNNTSPDSNGNINLPTVAGVSSVNGIGADGSGNVQIPEDFIDITTAPGFNPTLWHDNTAAINGFLQSGNRYYFPSGIYTASIVLPPNCEIYGAGQGTQLYAGADPYIIKINGSYCKIHDFKLIGSSPYNMDGIYCNSDCTHAHVHDVTIENCNNGIHLTGTTIWTLWEHVKSWGNKNNGLRIEQLSSAYFANLNSFISCYFNNNANEGAYLESYADRGFCENFIGCNFELNLNTTIAAALGGSVTASSALETVAGYITIQGCYFEGNSNIAIKGDGEFYISASVFVGESYLFDVQTEKCVIIGCKDYLTVNTILTAGSDPSLVEAFGNLWTANIQ